MSSDHVTDDLLTALEEAAERGVEVRVLFDHLGTLRIKGYRRLKARLNASKIRWRPMLPLSPVHGQWRRPDLRNHRKIMVIDGEIAFTGSQNLIEPSYNNPRHRKVGREWVELMACLRGPIVTTLNVVFATDWLSETDESLEDQLEHRPEPHPGNVTAQVVPSGPGFITENNLRLFNTLIYSAQHKISLCSPYFVPDDSLLYAVTTAAQRGVEVELFVSEKGDQFLVHHAQQSYYEALLEAGVRIYLYKAPFVLHAKHFTIDNEVAVLGSSNMDMRSFSLNLEVSVMLLGEDIVQRIRAVEDTYRSISHELVLDGLDETAHEGQIRGQRGEAVGRAAVARGVGTGPPGVPEYSGKLSLRELSAERREDAERLGPDFLVLLLRGRVGGDGAADAEAQFRRAVTGGR